MVTDIVLLAGYSEVRRAPYSRKLSAADKLEFIIESFNLSGLCEVAIVHDQASNMEAAGRLLVEKKKHFHSVTCAAHRLQNTIKQGLDVPGVSKLLGITRRLVTHFKHSVTAMDALRKHQEQTKERPMKFIQM